jgi:hypothetical protein
MSDVLAICANNNNNTEGVKVDTEWKDCTNPKSTSIYSNYAYNVSFSQQQTTITTGTKQKTPRDQISCSRSSSQCGVSSSS